MSEKIKVGIIGCGFVGGALKAWLEENNKDVRVFVGDMLREKLLQRYFEGRNIIAV